MVYNLGIHKMIYLISNTLSDDNSVVNLQVCQIKFNKFNINLNEFDTLVLTSKNAINSLKFSGVEPADLRVFSIGDATTLAARDFGFCDIIQAKNSHGLEFGDEILPNLIGKKVLYIRARETVSNLSNFFSQNGVNLTTIVGYENAILSLDESLKPPKSSIIVFASPKNVDGFVQNFGWDSSYKAVAIGNTTAKSLNKFTTSIISKTQSLDECLNLAKNL